MNKPFQIIQIAIRFGSLLGIAGIFSLPLEARGHSGSGTITGEDGRGGSYTRNVDRENGIANKNATWQNNQGGTGFRNATNAWNKESGTGTHQSSTTYANGQTTSSQGTLTKTGTGTAAYNGTYTQRNGQTDQVSKTYQKNGDGTAQVNKTVTTSNGQAVTTSKTVGVTENGTTTTGTITGPNGQTANVNKSVAYTNNGNGSVTRTATGTVTGPNGETKSYGNTTTVTPSTSTNSN